MNNPTYSEITPKVESLAHLCVDNNNIDPSLYAKYDVKRGLRDVSGQGVLAGLTEIADIRAYDLDNGKLIPREGQLFYRGLDVEDLVKGSTSENRFGFEETTYLLLFGQLPNKKQLDDFTELIGSYRTLPTNFVRDVVMKAPTNDMMNTLARSVLTLSAYDEYANDISIPNVLRQSIQLISLFPMLSVYGFQAYMHYKHGKSLYIHRPSEKASTAEVILRLLRPDKNFTPLEARILDIALVLHADHGGGNNSTFTNHVVTSTGTDTYSAVAASLGSLKGPKHGGANIKVIQMFEDMKESVKDWEDEDEVRNYLVNLLNKKAFDKSGLIYGVGHAVYSLSDPRAKVLKQYVEMLSEEKGMNEEYKLYSIVEKLAPEVIAEERKMYKGVSANIDFYSGFVYNMLGLPLELYTPIFAIARISGWSAHRLEELINAGKIIRPAYKSVIDERDYIPLKDR